MAIPVTSLGVTISVATQTSDEKPTLRYVSLMSSTSGDVTTYSLNNGYNKIPKVYTFPEISFTPETIDTTSYDDSKYKSSTLGLIDTSGVQVMDAFYSEELETLWKLICTDYDNGATIWLCVDVPLIPSAIYIPIRPVELSCPTITMNDAVRQKVSFSIAGDIVKDSRPI